MRLELDKINKTFGTNHVLRDVSFKAESGRALGLLGRNGSGKTTTIRIIMDLFPQDSGTVTVEGKAAAKFAERIGYLPEERGLYPKRIIADQMCYIGELRGMKHSEARKSAVKLLERLDAGKYFRRRLDTLSKGNQQKIQLAIALINDPDIIILDEPFSGLDPVNARILKELVEELVKNGKMVIFSSHQMGYVEEFCNDICLIENGGNILSGNMRQIKKGYPRNRVLIVPEDDRIGELERYISELPGFDGRTERNGCGCVVTLNAENDKNALFESVVKSGFGIDSFSIIEPSLEEIFIEKAGSVK